MIAMQQRLARRLDAWGDSFVANWRRDMEKAMSEVWIQPTGGALGADVHGVDLSQPLSGTQFERIAQAWGEHLVLRFSGQKIDDHVLMKFSARFGDLDRVPIAATNFDRGDSGLVKDAEEWVAVISSVIKDGKPVGGLGSYELVWHTDMSYNPLPPRASLLYALEVPPDGGNTGFLNMYTAYDTLTPELKRAIEGRTCIHDSSRNSAGELRKGFQRTLDVRRTPGAVHPLVRLHPVTKRKALFLGRRPGAYIHGLPVDESEALLDAVWAHATQEHFAWYQKWRAGDLVLWDNRCVMHRRDAFDESLRRLMHRTQIVGEPVMAG
jgi:alpha-ketoglutarate-dependent taurine dioxygenase